MDPKEILKSVETIVVVDWPTRDVPESLALAGFRVVVHGGPRPEDYSTYEVLDNGEVGIRHLGRPPERADLVYSYRPLKELGRIIATAKVLRAKTIWTQSGLSAAEVKDPKGCWLAEDDLQSARKMVESSGLTYITQPYIADIARELRASRINH